MANRIIVTAWREPGDDEDQLTVSAYPHGVEETVADDIRRQFDMIEPDNEESVDEDGCIIVTNETTISDGEVVEHNDKRFRVTITEVPMYEELPAETRCCSSTPLRGGSCQGVGGLVCELLQGHEGHHRSGAASWPK